MIAKLNEMYIHTGLLNVCGMNLNLVLNVALYYKENAQFSQTNFSPSFSPLGLARL